MHKTEITVRWGHWKVKDRELRTQSVSPAQGTVNAATIESRVFITGCPSDPRVALKKKLYVGPEGVVWSCVERTYLSEMAPIVSAEIM